MMRSGLFIFGICALGWLGCDSMQEVSLYEVDLTPTPEQLVSSYPYRYVYLDSCNSNLFGHRSHPCKRVEFVKDNSVEGEDHLSIAWHQGDSCRYLGVGFPWANYVGKNLKNLEQIAALQFHIRLDSGSVSKIPMFFSLVDYGGRQATSKINLLNVEGQKLDEEWRTAHIPLATFRASEKGLNLENVKELRIEFQREGHVHLDAIQIVPFHHEGKFLEHRGEDVCEELPLVMNARNLWWGLNGSETMGWAEGEEFLALHYDKTGPQRDWNSCGVALNQWEALDMSEVYSSSALTFQLHGQFSPLNFSIWSATGAPRQIRQRLSLDHCLQLEEDIWSCAIPIKQFDQHEQFNWSATREVRLTVTEDVDAKMHELQWSEYRGNPNKVLRWIEHQKQ